jgi:hypothetical protein
MTVLKSAETFSFTRLPAASILNPEASKAADYDSASFKG